MPWPLSKADKKELIKLGERVKAIRDGKGMSLEDVAKKIGKDRQSIHKLEKGDFNPTYIYLQNICKGLDIEMTELLR
jgi:transcriptional regulator with XRE-family HTH domain